MEKEIQVKPMVIPPIENVKINKTILVYDLPAGDGDDTYIVTLPVWGYANYYIKWGDGFPTETFTTTTVNSSNFPSRTLAGGRKYTIKIWGKIWRYGSSEILNTYLIEVKKIGPLNLSSAFNEAVNLIKVPKHLPKGVTTLTGTFNSCTQFNYPLDKWDVSNVTDMSNMFRNAVNFNQSLNNWNVSNVTTMQEMFYNATNFNQSLNNWNVGIVQHMDKMFYQASSFNQPLNNWNVRNVKYMNQMFYQASSFNQSLNNWNIESVQYTYGMFTNAISFNQPLNNWNIESVKSMSNMFENAISFNQPLNNWNVSNVFIMISMFKNATSFNQPLNNWVLSNLNNNLSYMFSGATSFNQPLNSWNVSNVTNMAHIFENAISFNQPLHNWNWTNITDSSYTANMLDYCGMSQYNYQLTLMGWYNIFNANISTPTGVSFGAKGLVYNNDRIIINPDPLVTAHDNEYFTPQDDIAVSFDL